MKEHHYYVYLVSSRSRVLYCGMTNHLKRRLAEHKVGELPGFTSEFSL
jgi:putative endonuclease